MRWFKVLVTIDKETFQDAIKGTDPIDALKNAYDNWEHAELIRLVLERLI